MLPQVAIFASVDLAARVMEPAVFDECTELRIPIVISAGKNLPREVRVVSSVRSDCMEGRFDFDVGRFRIVGADSSPGIRLESSQGEPEDKVSHECAGIDPRTHGAATSCKEDRRFASRNSAAGIEHLAQFKIGVATKAVVEEISFNSGAKYSRAKDVTKFDASEQTGVTVRMDLDSIDRENIELLRKCFGVAAVLKDIGAEIDCPVKTGSVKFR